MQQAILERVGKDAPFTLVERPSLPLGPNEVRIAIKAAAINPVDTKMRAGPHPGAAPPPVVLGCDVAGIVTEIGEAAQGFEVGDAVYGCAGGVGGRDGSYATEMRADYRLLAKKPANLDFCEAAALPLVAITAWEALVERAQVKPGDHVLVHGAAGGVGHVGVQIARALGGIVDTTISSPEKAAIALDLGADHAINYREQSVADYVELRTGGRGYDVVFDTIGGGNVAPSLAAIATNGRVVTVVARDTAPDLSPLMLHNATLHIVFMLIPMLRNRDLERHGDILTRVGRLVEAGRIRPLIDTRRFTLADLEGAHDRVTGGEAIGKVVIQID